MRTLKSNAVLLLVALAACGGGETVSRIECMNGQCPAGYQCRTADNTCTFIDFNNPDAAIILPDAVVIPPDARPPDAPPIDARPADAPTPPDAAPPDARPPDAAPPDARLPDAALPPDAPLPPDASLPDAAIADADLGDADVPDGAADATPPDGAADATPPDGAADARIPPPILAEVSFMAQGASRQVHQGDTTAVILITGTGLADVTTLASGTIVYTITMATPTMITASVSVPHGHPLGLFNLSVSSVGGSDTLFGALEVTPITSAVTGMDTSRGTPDLPWRTATAALTAAQSGDVVRLGAGDYTAGETFPLHVESGVGVQGNAVSPTRLIRTTGADQVMVVEEGASLNGLFISHTGPLSGNCIDVRQASPAPTDKPVVLSNLELDSCIRAIDDISVALTIDTVTARNISGIAVLFLAKTDEKQTLTVDGLVVEDADMGALTTFNRAALVLHDSMLTAASPVSLNGETVEIRDTTITNTAAVGSGVQINTTGATDLASAGLTVTSTGDAIDDIRPARAMANGPIIMLTGATLNGMTFAPGTMATGPVENAPYWNILNANNRLAF